MSPGAYSSNLTTNKYINEAFHKQGLPPQSLDLSTAYTMDLPTPAIVEEASESEFSDIWRNSRAYEFGVFSRLTLFNLRSKPSFPVRQEHLPSVGSMFLTIEH